MQTFLDERLFALLFFIVVASLVSISMGGGGYQDAVAYKSINNPYTFLCVASEQTSVCSIRILFNRIKKVLHYFEVEGKLFMVFNNFFTNEPNYF